MLWLGVEAAFVVESGTRSFLIDEDCRPLRRLQPLRRLLPRKTRLLLRTHPYKVTLISDGVIGDVAAYVTSNVQPVFLSSLAELFRFSFYFRFRFYFILTSRFVRSCVQTSSSAGVLGSRSVSDQLLVLVHV